MSFFSAILLVPLLVFSALGPCAFQAFLLGQESYGRVVENLIFIMLRPLFS